MRRWAGVNAAMKHGLLRSVNSHERDCRFPPADARGGRWGEDRDAILTGYEQYGCHNAVEAITAPSKVALLVSRFHPSSVPEQDVAVEAGPNRSGIVPCAVQEDDHWSFTVQIQAFRFEVKRSASRML